MCIENCFVIYFNRSGLFLQKWSYEILHNIIYKYNYIKISKNEVNVGWLFLLITLGGYPIITLRQFYFVMLYSTLMFSKNILIPILFFIVRWNIKQLFPHPNRKRVALLHSKRQLAVLALHASF